MAQIRPVVRPSSEATLIVRYAHGLLMSVPQSSDTAVDDTAAGQLSFVKVQGLEVPLMRARALQEGPRVAFQAVHWHNVHHPLSPT